MLRQFGTLILPTAWVLGIEVEAIDDLLEHTSVEFPIEYLQEKSVHITATEVITAGVPGNLLCWIELSPYPSINTTYWPLPLLTSTAFWAAIGGGGGALPPTVPLIEVATGVNGRAHGIHMPWTTHSNYARLVVQTPVSPNIATATWRVQAMIDAKTP